MLLEGLHIQFRQACPSWTKSEIGVLSVPSSSILVTPSRPLARPRWGLCHSQIPFAVSQSAQVPRGEGGRRRSVIHF